MNVINTLIPLLFMALSPMIFDFGESTNISSWRVVDDVVMGGRSSGSFDLDEDGHGHFRGEVSLENNGGFSSVRYPTNGITVSPNDKVQIRLKGDGKDYQFRVKENQSDYYSFIHTFSTSGDWEVIEIGLNEFYPAYRGRKLSRPNFDGSQIEEVAFLIGNKKPQTFSLHIDYIRIK